MAASNAVQQKVADLKDQAGKYAVLKFNKEKAAADHNEEIKKRREAQVASNQLRANLEKRLRELKEQVRVVAVLVHVQQCFCFRI